MSGEETPTFESGLKRDKPVHNTPPEEENSIFQRSKIVIRTPVKTDRDAKQQEELNMEEIKKMFLEMKQDLKKEMLGIRDEIRDDIRGIRSDIQIMREEAEKNREEVREMREEIDRMKEMWAREKNELKDKMEKFEEEMERRERHKIRNNLVVTGVELKVSEREKLKVELTKLIEAELGLKVGVGDAYKIGERKYVMEVNNWAEKLQILKEKRRLKGRSIYLESELTRDERIIQKKIRDVARRERGKGVTVRVKYQGAEINGQVMVWDRGEQKLVPKN